MKRSKAEQATDSFTKLLSRLASVPKREIDEQQAKYQKERDELRKQPAKKHA